MTEVTESEESKFEFQAFRYFPPEEKKMPRYIKRMFFWYSAVVTFLIIGFVSDDMLYNSIAMLILVTCIAQSLFSYFFQEQKIGKLDGLIEVRENLLLYKNEEFSLDELRIDSIKSDDYFKRKKYSFYWHYFQGFWFSFEPNLSRGTDNYLKFKYKDENYTFFFVLDSEQHMNEFNKVLWLFVENKCLDFKKGVKYLQIDSYSEVQKFKSKYYQE